MKFTASATFFSASSIGLAIGCTTAMRKVIGWLRFVARSLIANWLDLKPAPERADQAVAHGRIVGGGRGRAPHRLRPGHVAMPACNHVYMQLRDHIAERRDVEL